MYQAGDRVLVHLPAGELSGVVRPHRPGFYLVEVEDPTFASVVVGAHRLRPAADRPVTAGP